LRISRSSHVGAQSVRAASPVYDRKLERSGSQRCPHSRKDCKHREFYIKNRHQRRALSSADSGGRSEDCRIEMSPDPRKGRSGTLLKCQRAPFVLPRGDRVARFEPRNVDPTLGNCQPFFFVDQDIGGRCRPSRRASPAGDARLDDGSSIASKLRTTQSEKRAPWHSRPARSGQRCGFPSWAVFRCRSMGKR
jgi:hypothetical protein